MSKWILNHELVVNLIVKSVIGEHAENEYSAKPTEWMNYTRSDVFYCPINRAKTKTLPPVLIEVQYAANGAFLRRLNEYCLMIRKQHPILPVAKLFILDMVKKEDPTIENEAVNEDARQDAINLICIKASSQFKQAMSRLEEDVPESRSAQLNELSRLRIFFRRDR
ncbi:hypothetical protein MAM1_0041c02911 [Mucor ambiguus]|uniref:Uncharacterized protein n=1 Tax=Mucor ambiguus TaxID=91626 RepID=A0A0C9MNA4_9FUNG|nr:hypothetical protein MAM1_0041c02911 [Mucor ambiguus]